MYTLKSIAKRGTTLGAAFAIFAAAVIPVAPVFADELNPLTERSLLLSSSAPGFQDTDGSGNSFASPSVSGTNYAPAGSGPNGKKTGQTFSFRVSSDSTQQDRAIKAFTLQYCTSAAGNCQAPGDNNQLNPAYAQPGLANTPGDFRNGGDFDAATNDQGRHTNEQAHPLGKSDLDVVGAPGAWTQGAGAGQFQIFTDADDDGTFDPAPAGWAMTTSNEEDEAHSGSLTGKKNYITLTDATGLAIPDGTKVRIVFTASESVHITNPGSGAFFVKMNSYFDDAAQINAQNDPTPLDASDQTVIDGGVTVANVMTDSIHITTKVLETMSFSVGTENPDTQNVQHGICDPIPVVNGNRLNLGDVDAEYSLSTEQAYDTFSYWRLSSNSSGGASVYYSGRTLENTVGDDINEMGTIKSSQPGTEQFGLALIDAGADALDTLHADGFPAEHITPTISPLNREAPYINGGSEGDNDISSGTTADNAQFAFFGTSSTVPELIAQNDDQVVRCATSKVRYVANIAADTPAGVYTTKINYLAAPQY